MSSIDLNYFKNKYFKNQIFIKNEDIFKKIRDDLMVRNKDEYINLSSIDLFGLICDKILFYTPHYNQSLKSMLYDNKLKYLHYSDEKKLEKYIYRIINENVNRLLILTDRFSDKNDYKAISLESKIELMENMNNDIIYLSNNIILIKNTVFLSWLWKCRNEPIKQLDLLKNKFKSYHLKNKWIFG